MKVNVLLEGDIGSGKTTVIRTFLPEYRADDGSVRRGAGIEPFLLSLAPGAHATLGPNLCGSPSAPSPPIHHRYIPVTGVDWAVLRKYAVLLNTLPLKNVLETTDPDKRQYQQFLDVYDALADFRCDGCRQSFGPVDSWNDTRVIIIDDLTGLTTIARQNCVGGKPILSQPEYNPIMGILEAFLSKFFGMGQFDERGALIEGSAPSAVLIAHVDRETDPLTGMSVITAHTIGQKLAPRIVKMPDEIIMAVVDDRGHHTWSTDIPGTILKSRRLRRASGLAPDFTQLFASNRAIAP